MMHSLTGRHLIAGVWIDSGSTFRSEPIDGEGDDFSIGTPGLVAEAARAAEEAFWSYGYSTRGQRADFLEAIADEIEQRAPLITAIATRETGLPAGRIEGERGRTTGQLRLFAEHIRKGRHLDRRQDPALPDRKPLARQELRLVQRPVGPVAVFGASNFPLAFSTAGGDTAAALAAGCPVVVKGHSAHPGTGEIVAQALAAAIERIGLHPGVFSLIQGGKRDVGEALVKHPLIRAVGFTGSLAGGRALFDLCASRPEPIAFFGELGSINPMFMLPAAVAARAAEIGSAWAASLTIGAGQFCTNPGVAFIVEGPEADTLIASTVAALKVTTEQAMLTDGIASAYASGANRLDNIAGVKRLVGTPSDARRAAPYLFETDGETWLREHALAEEVFGPLGLVVKLKQAGDMEEIARRFAGQLTATLHVEAGDRDIASRLVPILERKAGRLLANAFPTGVEVCDAMVHGGPYPASTNFGATSVGTLSIRRFLRPVCYQGLPSHLLPADAAD
ncbi:aldehyde dehydrogenase (NADP(+)) (plasmid) [Bosea sp. F3-2]|uniref:aldehyde dehydrogenase (NADP(+)) n=1 Tax=Bosea sp. F3-2 TaxID=2599640 RepID=UPI0011ED215C|nr:aldehyde dehydrogenase (NADP(+)) [Bosea sp. F3-2]QEL27307.1 aldehyde dehydrogenase (NADP(+)) [Bosea sp. F3-2]